MGFFFLLTVWAWIRFVDEKTARPWRFYAMALCCYPLALFAKTTACTLPAALLLILWLKKRPIYWRRLAQVAPFVVMAIGMGLVTVWWERFHQGTQGKLFDLGPVERLLIASRALWFYLGKLLWPANLTFIYPRWNISTADPLAYGWLLATAAAVAVIWRARRWTGRGVEVAAIYYAATLSPVLGFIMLYTFVYSFVADHYQYLACIGPIALAAAGLELGLRRLPRARAFLQPALCAALLLTLGALTWRQCGMYADIDTLWRATIGRNPNCWLALNDLGADLYDQGHVDQAIVLLRKSAAIQPDNAETQNNLGAALDQEGQENEALLRFQKALALRPYFAEAHRNLGDLLLRQGHIDEAIAHFQAAITLRPDIAKAHRSLGEALVQKGEVNEGILQFQEALKLDPHYAPAYYTAGTLLLQQGRIDEAIAQFQKLLALRPDFAEAQNNLGYCLLQKGRAEEAITYLRKALEFKPDYAQAHFNLGNAFLQQGQTTEAIDQFQKLLALQPDLVVAQKSLATAYAEGGQFNQAVAAARRALQSAIQQNKTALAATIQTQLNSYEAKSAGRQ
jgi:tetratricopeptide (TPR) repeat protein